MKLLDRVQRIPALVWILLPASLGLGGIFLLSLRWRSLPAVLRQIRSLRRPVKAPEGRPRDRMLTLSRVTARLLKGRDSCLLESLLVYALLGDNPLVLGVQRGAARFAAHAWVEGSGVSSETFVPLVRLG